MTLYRFTSAMPSTNGEPVWVNPRYVVRVSERPKDAESAFHPGEDLTIIMLHAPYAVSELYVTESPEHVAGQLGWGDDD